MEGYIYKITNNVNGKVYIGQTITSLQKRWREHCCESSKCSRLKAAIRKYGKDTFTKEILWSGSGDREKVSRCLDALEIAYIKYYDSTNKGYNISEGGSGNKSSIAWTDERKEKVKGKHYSPNTEFKKGTTPWNKGIHFCTKYNEERKTPVAQYLNDKLINTYGSINDASRATGISTGSIHSVIKGKTKTAGGFIWTHLI